MAWILAPSLAAFRDEANRLYPDRDKASDGSIGDAAHSARVSDHNPDSRGIVHAYDLDEDLHGIDGVAGDELMFLAEHIRTTHDRRVKYVIYEARIFAGNAGPSPWIWRPYTGINAHARHLHLSVLSADGSMNRDGQPAPWGEIDISPWFPQSVPPAPPTPPPVTGGFVNIPLPILREGSKGGAVRALQSLLNGKAGQNLKVDGEFGPATKRAVINVQAFFGLVRDGVVGEKTWGVLFL